MDDQKRDRWKLYERILLVLTTLLIPATVWLVTSGAEREKLRVEYVRIATGILQRRPEEPDSQRNMREWAVAVLNKSSPVKLSEEQAEGLIDGTSRLSSYGYDGWDDSGYGYDDRAASRSAKKPSPRPTP